MSFPPIVKFHPSRKVLFCGFVYGIWLVTNVYLSGWDGIIGLSVFIAFILFFHFAFVFMAGLLRGSVGRARGIFAYDVFFRITVLVFVLWVVTLSFVIYENVIDPVSLPLLTITNGERTITFQAMSHIATPEFYDGVRARIAEVKAHSGTLFYEGVRIDSTGSVDEFSRILKIPFDEDMYENFAKISGLVAQDNAGFLGIGGTGSDVNADIPLSEIIDLYHSRIGSGAIDDTGFTSIDTRAILDIYGTMNDRERAWSQYVNRAIVTFLIKSESMPWGMVDYFGKTDIMDIIVNTRNERVVSMIQASDSGHIFLLYGLMHVNGILEKLRESDPRYHVTAIDELYPYH